MRGKFLNIEKRQSMMSKHHIDREERQIGKVFVIDGIKLVLGDEALKVRELEGDDTAGFEGDLEATDEVIDVRHVGHDIATEEQVRGLAIGDSSLAVSTPKNFTTLGICFSSQATLATLAAGSTPSTEIPLALKC